MNTTDACPGGGWTQAAAIISAGLLVAIAGLAALLVPGRPAVR